jgi:signal transduction histidine kinase
VVATGRPSRAIHTHRNAAGEETVVDVLATPVFNKKGDVVKVVESNRDITLHRRAEEAIKKSKEELEWQYEELKKVDRMKDALLGDVSHELKTPVAKQAMQLEILKNILSRHDVHGKVTEILEVMEGGVLRQQNVIRNILMASRLERGARPPKPSPVRIDRFIDEVLADYMHSINTFRIGLEKHLARAEASADRDMLWHVFSNILNNAVKYRAEAGPMLRIEMRESDRLVIVDFADNGVGFTDEEKTRAFDRFYQSASSKEGLGLGLNIARTLLEEMGGTIEIESGGRGKGSRVTVALPRAG